MTKKKDPYAGLSDAARTEIIALKEKAAEAIKATRQADAAQQGERDRMAGEQLRLSAPEDYRELLSVAEHAKQQADAIRKERARRAREARKAKKAAGDSAQQGEVPPV